MRFLLLIFFPDILLFIGPMFWTYVG